MPHSLDIILWQKGFYEHLLRPVDSLESVAWYIWLNPVRRGIVCKPEDFEHSGSFTGMKIPTSWQKSSLQPPWNNHADAFLLSESDNQRPASEGGPYKTVGTCWRRHGFAVMSLTNRNIPARPRSRTALSKATEVWCNLLNSTRRGSVSGVFCTETICFFRFSMRLLTMN